MPAAAVIPAPIVYLNVVAVKKLVVEFLAIQLIFSRSTYMSSALEAHSIAISVCGRCILL